MQARREVMEAVERMVMAEEDEVQQKDNKEKDKIYEERHRRRTRRSMQRYPSSPELGEGYTSKGKAKKFQSL